MLQVLIKKGLAVTEDVPAPTVDDGCLLIQVTNSCISAGTELTSVQGSRDSLVQKAFKHPEKVARAVQMARNEGIARTIDTIRGRFAAGLPTGYSIAGVVIAVGAGIENYREGDRVAAAGAGMANHAEIVCVPKNLVAKIPDNVASPHAATVTMGAIAMQAVRRADVKIGDIAVVVGTGILGMLALQLLQNAGARVIAVDIDDKRLQLARQLGAEIVLNSTKDDFVQSVLHLSDGHGADTMLFCAATNDASLLADTFAATRRKGKVVMVGIWGRELNRDDIYAKEIDFLISTSYGPGRYDENYELRGEDYPYAYVRWTENRNMAEYLRLIGAGKLQITPLIQAEYPVENADKAFQVLNSEDRPLIVILDYKSLTQAEGAAINRSVQLMDPQPKKSIAADGRIRVAVIGAGSFASGVHLPNLKKLKNRYEIHAICNRTGPSAKAAAQRYGAAYATTDYREVLDDEAVNLVMICTRHDLHGSLVMESLSAGKNTFVEKPLCTTRSELENIKSFFSANQYGPGSGIGPPPSKPLLMVGFNRRFSRYAVEIKKTIRKRINPVFIHYRMNAGYIPLNHWVHSEEGGGRIVGEACHIVDLFSFLVGSDVRAASAASLVPTTGSVSSQDNKAITIEYEDGSVAILEYFSIGSDRLPKERLEVHFDQKTIAMDNYKRLTGEGIQIKKIETPHPKKGQMEELKVMADALCGQNASLPISLHSIFETTDLCFRLSEGPP